MVACCWNKRSWGRVIFVRSSYLIRASSVTTIYTIVIENNYNNRELVPHQGL
jgi:hypothetical protein